MKLDIDYEEALDFEHCDDINEARGRLSRITNLLNRVIIERQKAKKEILGYCALHTEERLHKLSWDNKLVQIAALDPSSQEWIDLWSDAETAYRQLKNKQAQVMEDLMALKKIADITPR